MRAAMRAAQNRINGQFLQKLEAGVGGHGYVWGGGVLGGSYLVHPQRIAVMLSVHGRVLSFLIVLSKVMPDHQR